MKEKERRGKENSLVSRVTWSTGTTTAEFSGEHISEFGHQLMAGVGFKADPHVFDLSYRYQGSSDFTKDGTSIPYGSSNILAGIRYNF